MTIDEAIDGLKRIFRNYELDLPCTDSLDIETEIIVLLEELKSSRQELNELRKYSYVQGHSDGYNNAIDDAKDVILQSLCNERLIDTLHLRLEQLKAGGKNDNLRR